MRAGATAKPLPFGQWSYCDHVKSIFLLAERLGRSPDWRDIAQASLEGACASPEALERRFGSVAEVYVKLGLDPTRVPLRTPGDLLDHLWELTLKLGREPRPEELGVEEDLGWPKAAIYRERLGALEAAFARAKLIGRRLHAVIAAEAKLGRRPTLAEMVKLGSDVSMNKSDYTYFIGDVPEIFRRADRLKAFLARLDAEKAAAVCAA